MVKWLGMVLLGLAFTVPAAAEIHIEIKGAEKPKTVAPGIPPAELGDYVKLRGCLLDKRDFFGPKTHECAGPSIPWPLPLSWVLKSAPEFATDPHFFKAYTGTVLLTGEPGMAYFRGLERSAIPDATFAQCTTPIKECRKVIDDLWGDARATIRALWSDIAQCPACAQQATEIMPTKEREGLLARAGLR